MSHYNQKEIERYNEFINNIYSKLEAPKESIDKALNIINDINKKNYKNTTLPAIYGNEDYPASVIYIAWNFKDFVFYIAINDEDDSIEWFSKDRFSGQYDGGLYDFEDKNMWSWFERCQDAAPDNACLMY